MTTSNFTLFEMTRDEFVAAAMRKFGGLAKGQSPDADDLLNGTQALNTVLAKLQTIGMPLWARREYSFSPTAGTAVYEIGVGQTLNTPFPLKVQQALVIDTISGSNIEMNVRTIYEYNTISSTTNTGQPIQFFYQPKVNVGTITLWPTPDAASAARKQIKIVYQRPFEDFVASTDTPDFPQEWHQAIIYQLAATLAPEYGVPLQDRQMLLQEAKMYTEEALSFGNDEASLFFSPMERPSTHGQY